jgi:fructan beta-fructosidase
MRRHFITLTIILFGASIAAAAEDILIADFEGDSYGDWKVTGEAFGPGPAQGTLPGQMAVSGFEGRGLVNSYYGGDDTTGTLTSPVFTIQRNYINFLIGGGMHPGKACMNLLVDGGAVRSATGPNDRPGGSEALDWATWDVTELRGKQAVIEIVDRQEGGWGHINVDHIVQSDEKIMTPETRREMVFSKRYLNMPVKHGAAKRLLSVIIDGRTVREFVIELADSRPDYWVWLDIEEFKGAKATLKVNALRSGSQALSSIYQDDTVKEAETFYKEKNRQQFHFSSKRGWNNDSNGMVYYKGEYHLFYQHNPYGWNWGNMTWGHAVSTDSIHWTEIGDAIHPDKLGTIFSGSAVIDHGNTASFQTGDEEVMVCIYTSAGGTNALSKDQPFTQSLAYSNDRGRTWHVYEGNPVIEHINGNNRDPKVIWHEPTKRWVMALYLDDRRMGFFSSPDLKSWIKNSERECFHECPELFELPIDGDKSNTRWILYGASGHYLIGDFDGREFKPETEAINFHTGNCFYASQTYTNIPESDGRRIQIAWGQIATPGMPFNQCMLFPVELTLRSTEDGPRLFAEPIAEIRNIHGKKHTWANETVEPGKNLLSELSGELFHIRGQFEVGPARQMGFTIRGAEVLYDAGEKRISCKDKSAERKPKNGKIFLEILVDRNSIEIFGNQGRVYMPIGQILPEENKTLELFTRGGNVKVDLLEIYELNSIWNR